MINSPFGEVKAMLWLRKMDCWSCIVHKKSLSYLFLQMTSLEMPFSWKLSIQTTFHSTVYLFPYHFASPRPYKTWITDRVSKFKWCRYIDGDSTLLKAKFEAFLILTKCMDHSKSSCFHRCCYLIFIFIHICHVIVICIRNVWCKMWMNRFFWKTKRLNKKRLMIDIIVWNSNIHIFGVRNNTTVSVPTQ